jgi:hypothetical protein
MIEPTVEAPLKIDASFIENAFMNQIALTCWRYKVDNMPRELLARTPESELLLIKKGYLVAFRDFASNVKAIAAMIEETQTFRNQVDDLMKKESNEANPA